MIISGRTSLLALIDREKAAQGLSDAEICRRAGVGSNTLSNLRHQPGRSLQSVNLIALVNALGFDLAATPEQTK